MYSRIMVSTDGSPLSEKAVSEAIKLAKCTGAELVAFHALPSYMPAYFTEATLVTPRAGEHASAQRAFEERTEAFAKDILAGVVKAAEAAGVKVTAAQERNDSPSKAIVKAAEGNKCDCVVMASHGRRGLEGLLLGSETVKVLTHSTIPVLVVR